MTSALKHDERPYSQIQFEESLHVKRVWKEKVQPMFIDKQQYKVSGISSGKINTLVKYQLLNAAVAYATRQATDNI